MREWKDDGKNIISSRKRKFYIITSLIVMSISVITSLMEHRITAQMVLNVILGCFLIWGVQWNGFYKLSRKYAEYQLRKKDNKWRNYR